MTDSSYSPQTPEGYVLRGGLMVPEEPSFEHMYPVVVACRRWAPALGMTPHAFGVLACGYANYIDPKTRVGL